MSQNKVLLTGATGFIGANLARRLLDSGFEVHITTRKTSNKWRISDILPRLVEHVVDLQDFEKLKKIAREVKPNIIFHLANTGVYGGVSLPDKDLVEVNFLGTVNLIRACADLDYKCFVNTGSSAEYGPKTKPMNEKDICEPVNVYGVTKVAATLYGSYAAKTQNKPIVCLRLFSPFGPFDDKRRLITSVVTNTLANKPLLLANPKAVRDFIFVEDVIEAYLKVIDLARKFKGEIFNIGSGSQTTVAEVVDKVIEFTNSSSRINWNANAARAYESPKWEADIEKAKSLLGWKPVHSFEQGLKKTISWFLSFYN